MEELRPDENNMVMFKVEDEVENEGRGLIGKLITMDHDKVIGKVVSCCRDPVTGELLVHARINKV